MGTVGIKLQNPLSIRENIRLAVHAEQRGLTAVWTSEYQREAVVLAALLAYGTSSIRIGTSVLPIYTRSPAVIAMSAAAIAELAPGRVTIGLGSSTPVIVERWHGVKRRRPLTALRENISTIRDVLGGQPTHIEGAVVSSRGFRLEHGALVAPPIPIYAAALATQALRLAAEMADGVLLNATPLPYLPVVCKQLAEFRYACSDRRPQFEVAGDLRIGIASGSELDGLRDAQRHGLSTYFLSPQYVRFFQEAGYQRQTEAIKQAWADRDRERAAVTIDDQMLDDIVALGTETQIQQRIAATHAAGLEHVIVSPLWADEAPFEAIMRIIDVVGEVAQAN